MKNKPKLLQPYFYWNGIEPIKTYWEGKFTDVILIHIGNCFETRQECQQKGALIEKELRRMLDEGITLGGFKHE